MGDLNVCFIYFMNIFKLFNSLLSLFLFHFLIKKWTFFDGEFRALCFKSPFFRPQ